MLRGCLRVNMLRVECRNNSHCTALAALLRDPSNVLRELIVYFNLRNPSSFNVEQAARDISTSLVGNTYLKVLMISSCGSRWNQCQIECFRSEKLLCDVSSIESISNSNHKLTRITFVDSVGSMDRHTPECTKQCLLLNENGNKAEVIRSKILRFYFVGDFDLSPFVSMPLSVITEIMSQIEGNDKHSAVYKLLKSIPELCKVSDRECFEQPGNKKLQTSSVHDSSS
jgi:hypothetical protein